MFRWFLVAQLVVSAVSTRAQTICSIQGSGSASPFIGQPVTTTGIVTALYSGTGTVQGFFIEDPACDTDGNTSNGLFVYNPNTTGITLGDRVSVSGTVQEFQTLTELYAITDITVIGSGMVTPTDVSFPVPSSDHLERYEGMLLRIPGTMVVTDNDEWAHYGELLMAPDRLWQPTHTTDPNDADPEGTTVGGFGNVAAVDAAALQNALSSIILDDGRVSTWPDPPPLIGPEGTLRCGSQVFNLIGVLHYMYDAYRLHPATPIAMVHNPRPAPRLPGSELRIVSWNVHNYWSTLGGFGAENSSELARQRTKLVAAMVMMDVDALVLCELENNDDAWVDLLAGLNAAYGFTAYLGIEDDAGFGTKSVIFYKPAVLSPVGPLDSYYSATFERAHITQGFEVIANGARFLLSGVHLRSKLCDNATGANQDLGDGQGCFNARRIDQAVELAYHWEEVRTTTGINAQLVMGDFNSYLQEDPLDMLRSLGLADLVADGIHDYTYRYNSVFGAIDHAFGTEAMVNAVEGAEPWAINADEPPVLDYPDANIEFYQPNAYRSSDHDPVVVGVDVGLLTGLEDPPKPVTDVRFSYDAAFDLARWEGSSAFAVEVMDALGRRITAGSAKKDEPLLLDLSGVAAGAYVWTCTTRSRSGAASGRLVISR